MIKGVCPCGETLLQSLKLHSSGTPIVYLFLFSMSLMAVHFIQVVVHFKEKEILVIEAPVVHLPKFLGYRSEKLHHISRSLRVLRTLGRSILG